VSLVDVALGRPMPPLVLSEDEIQLQASSTPEAKPANGWSKQRDLQESTETQSRELKPRSTHADSHRFATFTSQLAKANSWRNALRETSASIQKRSKLLMSSG
jgi:hypothetical protein